MSANFPAEGDLFEDRYRVDTIIGSGGFARVYRAVQEDLGREVALKVLASPSEHEDSSSSAQKVVERFMREARLVSRLKDPHTITMYDHGENDEGLLYMVFEYVDGLSLKEVAKLQGAIEPKRVVTILEQTLLSLQEAHAIGVLHRDIKPGNIMVYEHVGRHDQVKVLDFGIAKMVTKVKQSDTQDLTSDGALIGTPRYMSPEQIRGHELTPQSDIYSLGLVAYELLMGRKAIESTSSVNIIANQLDPRPFFVPESTGCPEGLRRTVNRMLAKDLDVRYEIVDEVLTDLEHWDSTSAVTDVDSNTRVLSDQSADRLRSEVEGFNPIDGDVPDISDSVNIEPIEEMEVTDSSALSLDPVAPQTDGPAWGEGSGPEKALPWVIVALLLLVGGVGIAYFVGVSQKGDDEGTAAEESGMAVAESTGHDPEKEAGEEEQAPTRTIMVKTVPAALPIFIDGEPRGKSPIELTDDEVQFPFHVRAKLDNENERSVTVEAYTPEVKLDVTQKASAKLETDETPTAINDPGSEDDPPRKAKTNRKKERDGSADKKRKTTKKTTKKKVREKPRETETAAEDEDKDDTPEDEESGGGLNLPALDL